MTIKAKIIIVKIALWIFGWVPICVLLSAFFDWSDGPNWAFLLSAFWYCLWFSVAEKIGNKVSGVQRDAA